MGIQKKNFPGCGHRGFGEYCHLCKQLEQAGKRPPANASSSCSAPAGCTPDPHPGQPSNSDQPNNGGTSKVAKIEVRPAREVFGENAHNPDRPAVVAWTENGARFAAMVPLGAKYVDGNLTLLDPAKYQRSISYVEDGKLKSKFGAFVAKYGSWPRIGLTVNTRTDERGYLTIDLGSSEVK